MDRVTSPWKIQESFWLLQGNRTPEWRCGPFLPSSTKTSSQWRLLQPCLPSPHTPFPFRATLPLLSLTFQARNRFKGWSCVTAFSLKIKPEGISFEGAVPGISDGFFLRNSGIGRLHIILFIPHSVEVKSAAICGIWNTSVINVRRRQIPSTSNSVLGSEMHLNEILLPNAC